VRAHEAAAAVDEVRLGRSRHAVRIGDVPTRIADDVIRDTVRADELAPVGDRVPVVDPEEYDIVAAGAAVCALERAASPLQGTQYDWKKLITTALPRSERNASRPGPSSRSAEKAGAGPPIFGGAVRCVTRQTSKPSMPATAASATTWTETFTARI
jgi:hypothetical protein